MRCTDSAADNYNDLATEDDGSCEYTALGYADSAANNYNDLATEDDGSCEYATAGLLISDCDDFVAGPNANWTHILVATTVAEWSSKSRGSNIYQRIRRLSRWS